MCSTMWCTQISANEEITLLWGRRFVDAVALESMLLLLAGAAFFFVSTRIACVCHFIYPSSFPFLFACNLFHSLTWVTATDTTIFFFRRRYSQPHDGGRRRPSFFCRLLPYSHDQIISSITIDAGEKTEHKTHKTVCACVLIN